MIDIYLLYNICNTLNENLNNNNIDTNKSSDEPFDKQKTVRYNIISFTILIISVLVYNSCNNDNPFEIIFVVLTPMLYILYYGLNNKNCILKNKTNPILPTTPDNILQQGGFYTTVNTDTINSTISSIGY